MALRVYKPKNVNKVQAEKVTSENVADLCRQFSGRLVFGENERGEKPNVTGFQVATFDGVKNFQLGQYLVKPDDSDVGSMAADEFEAQFELARKVGTN